MVEIDAIYNVFPMIGNYNHTTENSGFPLTKCAYSDKSSISPEEETPPMVHGASVAPASAAVAPGAIGGVVGVVGVVVIGGGGGVVEVGGFETKVGFVSEVFCTSGGDEISKNETFKTSLIFFVSAYCLPIQCRPIDKDRSCLESCAHSQSHSL